LRAASSSSLLGFTRLARGFLAGKLLGALPLEALALGALRGFPPGPREALLFLGHGAALGLADLAAQQVAAIVGDGLGAVLLAHLARLVERRHGACVPRAAAAAGREHEEEDDGEALVHGSPFRFGRRAPPPPWRHRENHRAVARDGPVASAADGVPTGNLGPYNRPPPPRRGSGSPTLVRHRG